MIRSVDLEHKSVIASRLVSLPLFLCVFYAPLSEPTVISEKQCDGAGSSAINYF